MLEQARGWYAEQARRYPPWLVERLGRRLDVSGPADAPDDALIKALADYQRRNGLKVDGRAGPRTLASLLGHDLRPRPDALPGTLNPDAVKQGKQRERFGLFQRRVRARTFGEPRFELELVPEEVHIRRPHVLAWDAWRRMRAAAEADGLDARWLEIHSAYRSVAWQRQIFEARLAERRQARRDAGQPELSEQELRKRQRKWTAEPGTSAHHTGFALDLALYQLGKRRSKRCETYAWLAHNAAGFGFYPYLPEGWHWEFNPPGLLERLRELRRRIRRGQPFDSLLSTSGLLTFG